MAINETFKKVLEKKSKPKKMQSGGTFTYTSEAYPLEEFDSQLQVDPSQYIVGGVPQQAPTADAPVTSGASVDVSDIMEADGETAEKAYYIDQIRALEAELRNGMLQIGDDYTNSRRARELMQEITRIKAIAPTELKNNLDLRLANEKWLEENEAGINWATTENGAGYYYETESGDLAVASLEEIFSNPQLVSRILTNKGMQSKFSGRELTNAAFDIRTKNDVKNSVGFNKAIENIYDVYNEATGSEQAPQYRILNNKNAIVQAAKALGGSGILAVTQDITSNEAAVKNAFRNLMASRSLDQKTVNAIQEQALRNVMRNTNNWTNVPTLKNEEGEEYKPTYAQALAEEMEKILVQGVASKLDVSVKEKIGDVPGTGGSGPGSGREDDLTYSELGMAMALGQSEIETGGVAGVATEFSQSNLNKIGDGGKLAPLELSIAGKFLRGSEKMILNGEEITNSEAISEIKKSAVITGNTKIKQLLVELNDDGKTVKRVGGIYESEQDELRALQLIEQYKSSVNRNQLSLDKGEISEEVYKNRIKEARTTLNSKMKEEVELKEDVNPNNVVIGSSLYFSEAIVDGGETKWVFWDDDVRKAVSDFDKAGESAQNLWQEAWGREGRDEGDKLFLIKDLEFLLPNELNYNDVAFVERNKLPISQAYSKRGVERVRPFQPLTWDLGQVNVEDLTTAGNEFKKQGGKILKISFKDLV